jgi:hypothetical protein
MSILSKLAGLLGYVAPVKPVQSLSELRAEVLIASMSGDHATRDRALAEYDAITHSAQGGTGGAA